MSLKEQLQEEMKVAMRAKDKVTLQTLRALKSQILLAETAEGRGDGPLTQDEELKMLTKQAKQRRDSAAQYRENGRADLAETEEAELKVIERFLPAQLTPEELAVEVKAIIEQVGATSKKDMGKVMGAATKKLAGRADGKAISSLVRDLLP